MADTDLSDIPEELRQTLVGFDTAITNLENVLKPLHDIPLDQLQQEFDLSTVEMAKINLFSGFALNSLFWVNLIAKGEYNDEHGIKSEIERYKGYMDRARQIEDKAKAPKLDKDASKRFIRNSLWSQAQSGQKRPAEPESTASSEPPAPQQQADTPQAHQSKKKRKKSKNKQN